MTLTELCATLPNGLHDAFLKSVTLDYRHRKATIALDVWVGDLHAASDDEREAYRPAKVALTGLAFWVCEPPSAECVEDGAEACLRIDHGAVSSLAHPPKLPPAPAGCFVDWIFVDEWNACVYVAAEKADIAWVEGDDAA
jgi:hypothetical protein